MPHLEVDISVDDYNFMRNNSLQARLIHCRKNWLLHLVFIHYIAMHSFTLQFTVTYPCWIETFHLIIFLFFFLAAIDNCNDSPCLNNGTCNHLQDGFSCDCAQGFTGLSCQGDSVLISFQLRKAKQRFYFQSV